MWKETLAGLPDYAQVRVTATKKKLKNGIWLVEAKAEVPVMESISGQNSSGYTAPPKVAYVDTVLVRGMFSERGTLTGRRLARQMAINLAGNISTSVAAATSGPVPDLFDALVQAT